jgi:hypothetical protein
MTILGIHGSCVGLDGMACGGPAHHPGKTYGIDGGLCDRCRSCARRRVIERDRPHGLCSHGCGRAATSPRGGPSDGPVCERCRAWPYRPRTRIGTVPCSTCGTPGGPPSAAHPERPARFSGRRWRIPGSLCTDCRDDAKLARLDEADAPGTYLPPVEMIYRTAAELRTRRTPEGWAKAENEATAALASLAAIAQATRQRSA